MGFLLNLFPGLAAYRFAIELVLIAACVALGAWFVHHAHELGRAQGRAEVQARWDAEVRVQQAAAIAQAQENAIESKRRMAKQQENQDAQTAELIRYRQVAADAVAARDSLQLDVDNLAAVARRAGADSATVTDRAAGAAAAGVLADVSAGADALAEIYAREADATRRHGILCERDYDALTVHSPP